MSPPSSTQPTDPSTLLFPSLSLSRTLTTLHRTTLSLPNRLRSIQHDALFITHIATLYALPLIANERCGSWYMAPSSKAGSAYFKSTDGHWGEWACSLRRLNLGVLRVAGRAHGCIIVDSTRRGKSMPDALSKTIPIWCAVMNRLLFPDLPGAHALYTPPRVVGGSEHAQIEARLAGFVEGFEALRLPLDGLRVEVGKPLRPLWVTQESPLPPAPLAFKDFHPVVCCTASRRVEGAEVAGGGYVQGAGDDCEGWACGLTPMVFWGNKEVLMATVEEELPQLIEKLVGSEKSERRGGNATLVKPTADVYIGALDMVHALAGKDEYDWVVTCSEKGMQGLVDGFSEKVLNLRCGTGKLGSRDLRKELCKVKELIASRTRVDCPQKMTMLFACPTGKDLAVGVALMVLCVFFDSEGNFIGLQQNLTIDKQFIRQRLSWIMASKPDANPSRSTLQAVNSFLMERPP